MLQPVNILTEKDVQRVALSALRSYYRFRVKADTPELISDVRGAGGIIADVQYSYKQQDGSRFMATLEATAADTKNEVYFRRRLGLLLVDGAAFGSLVTAAWFFWTHLNNWGLVIHYSTFAILLLLLGMTLLVGAAGAWLVRNWRRYRYIYAVEQFKQYYADEQWIAISEEVFPDQQNVFFQELREQCIRYGFGLMQIDRQYKPHLLITPARKDVFDNQRRRINFFTLKQLERLQRGGVRFREQFQQIIGKLPVPVALPQLSMPPMPLANKALERMPASLKPSDPAYLFRFKRSYQNQQVAIVFSLALIATVFIREVPQRPIRYVSQQQYAEEVTTAKAFRNPEPIFVIDPFDTIYIQPFDTTVVPYLALLRSESMIADGFVPGVNNEVLIGMFEDALILYDCERLYNFQQPKYMVEAGVYPDFESASRRMGQLLGDQLDVNCLWMGCFGERQTQYVLYFGLLQNTLLEAQQLAAQYQKRLAALQLPTKLRIRMLTRRGT